MDTPTFLLKIKLKLKKTKLSSFFKPKCLFTFSILAFIICSFMFGYKRYYDIKRPIDAQTFGTLGDFFGGILGSFFALVSVYWMYKAFMQQRNESFESRKQVIDNHRRLEIQRFHDLFFELLHLYQNIVNDLCGSLTQDVDTGKINHIPKITVDNMSWGNQEMFLPDNRIDVRYDNKDFFDFEKVALYGSFECNDSFEECLKNANNEYLNFYVSNKKMGIYFRTLFRLIELIDRNASQLNKLSTNNNIIIKDYLKVLRAQLTESELFFLRYNAQSPYGFRFAPLLDKYNILKHLCPFDLLEYKLWSKEMNDVDKLFVNVHFKNLKRQIIKSIKENIFTIQEYNVFQDNKYKFFTRLQNEGKTMSITIKYIPDRECQTKEYKPFDFFTPDDIQQIFNLFLMEIFIYSHFKSPDIYNHQLLNDNSQEGEYNIIECQFRLNEDKKLRDLFPHL